MRFLIKYWLPVLVWMGLIFTGSADASSGSHISRLVAPVVRWLFPHISEQALDTVVLCTRKCGHLGEYAVLAILLWRALGKRPGNEPAPRRWPVAALALLLAALYAASDEFHQTFVPTRTGSVLDVLLDTFGAMLGLAACLAFGARLAAGRRRPQLCASQAPQPSSKPNNPDA
jgi:VanZ family protein